MKKLNNFMEQKTDCIPCNLIRGFFSSRASKSTGGGIRASSGRSGHEFTTNVVVDVAKGRNL